MKTFTILAACAAMTTGAFAAPAVISTTTEVEIVAAKDEKTVTLKVTGMTWPNGCGKKVQVALTSVKGVSKATVTVGKAVVKAKKDVKTADLIAALKKAGYGGEEA